MHTYGDSDEGVSALSLEEPEEPAAPEYFRELFTGPPDESDEQRAARVAVAGDVLIELLKEGTSDVIAMEDARFAAQLTGIALLRIVLRTAQPNRTSSDHVRTAA